MEKELTELYEKAKKAAEVAESSPGEECRCLDALERLKKFPVNYQVLVSTQVGKRIRQLTKHRSDKIKALASEVVEIWKSIIVQETKTKNGTPNGVKTEPADTEEKNMKLINSMKVEQKSSAKIVKTEPADTEEKNMKRTNSMKVEQKSSAKIVKTELAGTEEKNMKRTNSMKVELKSSAKVVNVEKTAPSSTPISQNSSIKSEFQKSSIKSESQESIKVEVSKSTSTENCHVEKKVKVEKSSFDPHKLTSLVSCKDPARDKIREMLAEAFCKVSSEIGDDLRDTVNGSDPNRVAVLVETAMFENFGKSTGAQKQKYRSIMFNIKDPNNPDFRRKVLIGEFEPRQILELTPEQMASDARQQENKTIKQRAMYNSERAAAPKASTDQFTCGRCKKKECTYYQLQTRSADEPMTTFVTCVNCDNHWKFC